MVSPFFDYLVQGEISKSILYVLNNYFIYGTFWFLLGITIFVVVQAKVQDYNISGVIMALYFIVMSPYMSYLSVYARYIQILLGVFIAFAIYKILVKK